MRNLTFAIACLTLLAGPTLAQTVEAPLSTANNAEEGEYLVDPSGMSLYTFKADTQGSEGTAAVSACEADCLGVWPPLIAIEQPVGDDNVRAELLGKITRSDGSEQVTYNGWPLYYYAEDAEPGDIKGDDIESFGEDWYLIGPNGDRPDRDNK
jgi:predicted lipoprotein with Yx(FWY)xxD motif